MKFLKGSKLKEMERNACLNEILTTEENYVIKLKWLKEVINY